MSGQFAAVITAAGLSSRMHAFKPLLPVGDAALIQRTLSPYVQIQADPIVIVTGFRAEELESFLRSLPFSARLRTVRNPDYAVSDMFTSIRTGLRELRNTSGFPERIFLSPADVPLVSPATLLALGSMHNDAIRPVYRGKGGHPLLLSASAAEKLLYWKGADGMRSFFRSGQIVREDVPVDDPAIIMDADTPDDYSKILSYYNTIA